MTALAADGRVLICQRAFLEIEHDCTYDFISFDVDTIEQRRAQLYYDHARQQVLAAVDWNFARALASVAEIEAQTERDRPYAFALPPGCIAVRAVEPRYARWQRVGQQLHASCRDVEIIRYTDDVVETARFTADFEACLVKLLAHYFAPGFTASQNRAQIKWQEFQDAIEEASLNNGYEQKGDDAYEHLDGEDVYTDLAGAPGRYGGYHRYGGSS